jgi:hypothetical protein
MNRAPLYAALLALVVVAWNTWWGDPMLYHCYSSPFQFNPGEFSASMTSPVWHLLTFWMSPLWFRVLSAFVAFLALWSVMDSQRSIGSDLLSGALIFPVLSYGVMGYETALAVFLTVMLWRGNRVAWLLPLVRPEAALLLIWVYRKDLKGLALNLAPFAVWAAVAYAFGSGLTSIETRLDNFNFRYLAVFWTWLVLEVSNDWRWSYLPALLVVGFIPFRELQGAYRDARKGWDFDTISLRQPAEFINQRYDSVTVGAYEIQVRYWLKPSIRVASVEGLVVGKPDIYLATDRNIENGNTVANWEYRREGFLRWAEVRE